VNIRILIILISIPVLLKAQWVTQNPLPTAENLEDVLFLNEYNGFIGGSSVFLKTIDGGASWEKISIKIDKVRSIFFINNNIGWVSGYEKIFRTTDCGNSWQLILDSPGMDILKIFFTSINTGYFISNSVAFKTTNGGDTWTKIFHEYQYSRFSSVYFIDDQTGWILDEIQGRSWKTTNAGESWNFMKLPSPAGNSTSIPRNIFFVNEKTGFIAGPNKTFLKTTNGGVTWKYYAVDQNSYNTSYYDVYFRDTLNGWVVGNEGLYQTLNGGLSWFKKIRLIVGSLKRIHFSNDSVGYAVGEVGLIYKTTNAGKTWKCITQGERDHISGSHFIDKELGFAVGWKGLILKTTNGGETWIKKSAGTTNYLDKIHFVSASTGYIAGDGPILKSTDGGETWHPSSFYANFRCLFFIDENNGWAGGYDGLYAKTTDGGSSWSSKNVLPYSTVSCIYFIDRETGFMQDRSGKIQKSTDGGITWHSEVTDSSAGVILSIAYTEGIIYAAGTEALIRSTDMGSTWEKLGGNKLMNLQFPDELNGFALRSFSPNQLLSTEDGGHTWNELPFYCNNISFVSSKTGWAFDYFGIIKRTDSGGKKDSIMLSASNEEIVYSTLLFQNFPNPFNPVTNIRFSIAQGCYTRLHIFDILGREIALLVNEYKQPGEYQINFNGTGIASGVYFYTLIAGSYSITRKLILIK
jgi:photosystem II stability/assembly factor-like uncharacterized protein